MEEDLVTDLLVLQSHLDGMIDLVKKNSTTLSQCQDFELRLLNLNSLSEIIEHIVEDAQKYFDLDIISLCLIDEANELEKLLNEEGLDYKLKKGLVLLQNKQPLQSIFGYGVRPYIGPYKNDVFSGFFSDYESNPASIAIIPLNRRGKYLGSLNLGSYQWDRFASSMAMDFVVHLSCVVSVCLENSLNFETIKRTSYIDTLTGVNNRRFLDQRIIEELDRCQRNSGPISCLFLDIDFFKLVNDEHGHQAGDQVLTHVAKAIKTQLRNNDILARYGGEEFVTLLSDIDEAKALEIAERIRKTVEMLKINVNSNQLAVTVSIGLSTYSPGKAPPARADEVAKQLLKSADTALYKAKCSGKNRVEKCETLLSRQIA